MAVILQNQRQYDNTKAKLAKLEAAYEETKAALQERDDLPEVIKTAQLNGMAFLMEDLRAQLTDYEKLRAGGVTSLNLDSLDQIPLTLVRARIARGLTQRQLADMLGTREQQVQRDEDNAYARASLEKLVRVADVLGISVKGKANLAPAKRMTATIKPTRGVKAKAS